MMSQNRLEEILEVRVFTRPNLRDDEMISYVGQNLLRDLFDYPDKDLSQMTDITLIYPERWLNILEQRVLLEALKDRCPNAEKIVIVTHSVYIIQCTPNGCCFVCDTASNYPDQGYTRGQRYCPEEKEQGLQVFHM